MRCWVDPVNNFVFADVHGAIGYQTRGQVPVRARANAWVPVPGWTGAHEWRGAIPFEALPAVRDPATGWVATANSKVTGPEYPHDLGIDHGSDFRTRRLAERLRGLGRATVADMAHIHADRVSLPARELLEGLAKVEPADAPSGEALRELRAWDGVMDRDSVAATLYSALRDRLMRDLMTPLLGPLAGQAFATTTGGPITHMARLRGRLGAMIRDDDRTLLPPGEAWPGVLARALSAAVAELRSTLGSDMATWRWGRLHATQPRHPLAASFPALAPLLNPPGLPMGGDNETVQAGSYIPAAGYALTSTSVARYAFDLGDWEQSAWVVPLGASGHPGSPHYADQAQAWSEVRLLPMRYDWARIRAEAESQQTLDPA
jgi:penicillin amidase